eukprot:TRINITY_DN11381_c0_g1_i1.p1 TRINITY_DN11381_c0_g1~~TRINITY_DN11381_c0_g1_i1.p1  ORF type:complete len:371 (+),score=106.86 TRINITY_DN11381_c0_g1_i1:112-1113(+)
MIVAQKRGLFSAARTFATAAPRISPHSFVPFAGALFGATAYFATKKAVVAAETKYDWEKIKAEIATLIESDPKYDDGSYAPVLIRLAWHASGTYDMKSKTGGSNGAGMRYEKEGGDGANAGLAVARKMLEPVKRNHPQISYADLWTLASVIAIKEMGGPAIPWRPGRTDFTDDTNLPPRGRLPNAALGGDHIRDVFYRMGFNDREIVALIGAHAVGRCHRDRSGFLGPWTKSPTMFSNEYFRELVDNTWTRKNWEGPMQYTDPSGELMMLPADIALIEDPTFRRYVREYAKDEQVFFRDFAAAYSKLLELGVKFPSDSTYVDVYNLHSTTPKR